MSHLCQKKRNKKRKCNVFHNFAIFVMSKVFKSSRNYKAGNRKKRKYEPVMSAAVERAVEKLIKKNTETKIVTNNNYELGLTTLSTGTVYDIVTPLNGSGANQRVGNRIQPVGIGIKTLYHTLTSTEALVRQLVLEVKQGYEITNTEVLSSLFESQSGADIGVDGTLRDAMRKVNREMFRVLKDDVLIFANATAERTKMTRHYFKLSGEMIFSDINSTLGQNKRYVVVTLPMEADGDESLGQTIEFSYNFDFYYKDM